MKIACIGWGSLIWRPAGLPIHRTWFGDGPILPIEFTRQSTDNRITLIIDEFAQPVRTLWALMATNSLIDAMEALKEREGVKKIDAIHSITPDMKELSPIHKEVKQWINRLNLDAAIWTGLSYSAKTGNTRPSLEYVINHLRTLEHNKQRHAEEYIRKVPLQIDTEYRYAIELHLGWTPQAV